MSLQLKMELVNEYGAHALLITLGESTVLLGVDEIDEIIEQLGLVRPDLAPAVPLQVPRDQQFPIETQTRWQTIVNPLYNGAVLFFRHSGFGWAGFAVPTPGLVRLLDIGKQKSAPLVSQSIN